MSPIAIPPTVETAPAASQPFLEQVEKQLGVVPNLFRLVAHSPAALGAYVSWIDSLGRGALPAPTRERIALAVAEWNGCSYCLSAHAYLGRHRAKLDDTEIAANRRGTSNDRRAAAAVRFAVAVLRQRGHVSADDLAAVRAAGYDDGLVVEILMHVALDVWTNDLNEVARTDIDFPVVAPDPA